MDIKHLQYFVVSVDMGSFHAAAKILFTTQSHISKTIKALEQDLEMTLLERKSTGVTPTKEGQKIYRYAVNILKEVKNISDMRSSFEGYYFSIATLPSDRLAFLMAEYYNHLKCDKLQMDFFEGSVEEVITRVHRRKSEIGFVSISERHLAAFQNQIKTKGLCFHELECTKLYLYVGEKNPFYKKDFVDASSIHKKKLICNYEEHYSLIHHLGHIKEDTPLKNDVFITATTNSDYFISEMLRNTDCSHVGSDCYKSGKEKEGIRRIPISMENQNIIFGYIKRTKDEIGEIAKDFLVFITEAKE